MLPAPLPTDSVEGFENFAGDPKQRTSTFNSNNTCDQHDCHDYEVLLLLLLTHSVLMFSTIMLWAMPSARRRRRLHLMPWRRIGGWSLRIRGLRFRVFRYRVYGLICGFRVYRVLRFRVLRLRGLGLRLFMTRRKKISNDMGISLHCPRLLSISFFLECQHQQSYSLNIVLLALSREFANMQI